ncbi:MAG: DUF4755 domain-containing protein [Burkholderiaceae bacterium]|nr:DUF4755 domain-containing protein [Burkholderiaceae bacterium]
MIKEYKWFVGTCMTIAFFMSVGVGNFVPLLIIGAIVAWMLNKEKSLRARRESLAAELLSLVGAKAGDPGVHVHNGMKCGIAINPATQKLALAKKGTRKAYSFDDVREWSSSKETAGHVMPVGGGLALGMMAAAQNGAAAGAAAARTGFFVSVRDIEHPKWRVEMPNIEDQARWMEILRQGINGD